MPNPMASTTRDVSPSSDRRSSIGSAATADFNQQLEVQQQREAHAEASPHSASRFRARIRALHEEKASGLEASGVQIKADEIMGDMYEVVMSTNRERGDVTHTEATLFGRVVAALVTDSVPSELLRDLRDASERDLVSVVSPPEDGSTATIGTLMGLFAAFSIANYLNILPSNGSTPYTPSSSGDAVPSSPERASYVPYAEDGVGPSGSETPRSAGTASGAHTPRADAADNHEMLPDPEEVDLSTFAGRSETDASTGAGRRNPPSSDE